MRPVHVALVLWFVATSGGCAGHPSSSGISGHDVSDAPAERDCRRGQRKVETGIASYYADSLAGRPTASGEPYEPRKLTAAHQSLAFGTVVCVVHHKNNRSVKVTVNDRGPFVSGRIIDLSRAAAKQLDLLVSGIAPVDVYVIASPSSDNP